MSLASQQQTANITAKASKGYERDCSSYDQWLCDTTISSARTNSNPAADGEPKERAAPRRAWFDVASQKMQLT
jgi:hypothetical protein